MATEQAIQKKIIKYLESQGCYVVNGVYSKAGIPDLIGCYKGKFFGIEVKKPDTMNTVSKLQEYNLQKIKDLGGNSIVASDVKTVEDFLGSLGE